MRRILVLALLTMTLAAPAPALAATEIEPSAEADAEPLRCMGLPCDVLNVVCILLLRQHCVE